LGKYGTNAKTHLLVILYWVLNKISGPPTPKRKISSMKVCIMLGHRARIEMQEKKQMYLSKLPLPAKRMATLKKKLRCRISLARISLDFLKFLDCEATSYLQTCTNIQMNQHEPALLWICDKNHPLVYWPCLPRQEGYCV
jgi:hypothetical protein